MDCCNLLHTSFQISRQIPVIAAHIQVVVCLWARRIQESEPKWESGSEATFPGNIDLLYHSGYLWNGGCWRDQVHDPAQSEFE